MFRKVIVFTLITLVLTSSSVLAADGYGRNATGGSGGSSVTVTTAAQFKSYATSASKYIITVSGSINLGRSVSVKSNKTIKGANTSATITGCLNLGGQSNFIIQNLNITNLNGDGITINNTQNVFITKCNVYQCGDGCIDITKASDNVTISWCKFYYNSNRGHNFVNLVGADDGDKQNRGKLHVTFHHNWWSSRCVERMPSVRFGRAHVYNNYFSCSGNNYCIRARIESQCLIENNYFEGVKNPYVIYVTTGTRGGIKASGNTFSGCRGSTDDGNDSVFTPQYSYSLASAASVKNTVMSGAGNR